MKNKILTIGIAAFFLIFSGAVFAASPDLSGTWTLDKAKSEGLPPDITETMVIKHTGNKIQIESTMNSAEAELTVPQNYTLASEETKGTPETRNGSDKIKVSAKRTADGIEILESINYSWMKIRQIHKYWLSADGKTLTVISTQQSIYGTKEVKSVFNKQ